MIRQPEKPAPRPCGVLFRRGQRQSDNATTKAEQNNAQPRNTAESMVDALKGTLRQLAIDLSLGTITGEEYASAKRALEGTVKRALACAGAG